MNEPLTNHPVLEPAAPRHKTFSFWHETVLIALLGALLGYARVVNPEFLALPTQLELLTHVWELALLAIPMTLIIVTGGIDLSVGSMMALCAVVLGLLFERGVSPFVGAVAAVCVGLGAGALNGFFVARMKVHPLIVTLATLAAFRGVAEGISLARPISGFPAAFTNLSHGAAAIIFLIAAAVAAFVLAKTAFGLSLYGIGHNETAMRFSGWNVDRAKMLLYTLSGGAAAIAAIEFVARRNTAKADIGTGIELDVITAVVLGGTSIFGGRGHIFGTLLGLLLIHEMREFVSWRWSRDELNFIVLGVLLILSVLLNRVLSREERE